ncbi:MAG: tyrosine-type recombinase/integrase [Ornithinimicrobium sp.]|uniref:tyrosine-type recombinase/integrase n=1 Tax=Ornithinimicrobium sp. TaxID=1977084 RepID=UPI003D9ACBDD
MGKPRKRPIRRGFGAIRVLPSRRVQASYVGPDLQRYSAPYTFDTRLDAEEWLAAERRLLTSNAWTPPKERQRATRAGATLADYAPGAVDRRRVRGEPLRPRTRVLYLSLVERVILPGLGARPLGSITPEIVADWYGQLDPRHPTQRAHAYSLLRTILGQAVEEQLLPANPCQVRGAGRASRARRIQIATPDELVSIAAAMPGRLQLLVLLAGWCGLRYGELAELRRGDIDTDRGLIAVSRAVVRVAGQDLIGLPKSHAGVRAVAVPPHLLPAIVSHLDTHTGPAANALLFPRRPGDSRHMMHTELTKTYNKARTTAGRPDLRLHDLRHTGATLAAQTGATLAELMARLGHSTPAAALRYQHAAAGRDAQIAVALSKLALIHDPPRGGG